jgi:hypothetical protein
VRTTSPMERSLRDPIGRTRVPGASGFLGLPRLHTMKSGLLLGVGDDAESIASKLVYEQPLVVNVRRSLVIRLAMSRLSCGQVEAFRRLGGRSILVPDLRA